MGVLFSKVNFAEDSNTLYLVQVPRGLRVLNISPFPLKLETYLRVAKIPYENIFSLKLSSKSKTPWMHHRDRDVADSQFCIEYLNKEFEVNLDQHLTKEEQAMSRAILKMVEENLFWVYVCYLWVYGGYRDAGFPPSFPWYVLFVLQRRATSFAHAQGMSRHSPEEVYHIGKLDLQALSDYLGDKKFFFGDKPCVADCGVFGLLAQFVFNRFNCPLSTFIPEQVPNLERFCHTMRDAYWPDWDELLKAPV